MEEKAHPSSVWSGGLLAISLVMLQGFLSGPLDLAAFVAVLAFALSIPVLTCNLLVNFMRTRRDSRTKAADAEMAFYILGIFIALVGIVAAFWHMSWIAALAFLCSALFAFAVYIKVYQK